MFQREDLYPTTIGKFSFIVVNKVIKLSVTFSFSGVDFMCLRTCPTLSRIVM